MYADNISFAMCSLLFKVPSAVPLCWKLVGCPTENSQVYTFSTNIFLTSIRAQLHRKIYKRNYMHKVARSLNFFKIVQHHMVNSMLFRTRP